MQSQDKLADLLRAYIKEEAPGDIWQVVSADISTVLRKLIALSAECQRAKLELDRLKKGLEPLGDNLFLHTQMRNSILQNIHDAEGNVEMNATIVNPPESEGFFLAPGQTVRLPQSAKSGLKRPFMHWCKVCNELSRSINADPATCPRRECRSAFWRTGKF